MKGKKDVKKILCIISVIGVLIVLFSVVAFAVSRNLMTDKTINTYMNSSVPFSSYYETAELPSVSYKYRDLKCASTSASMYIKMYGRKIQWYDVMLPSETELGNFRATGINANNPNTWYGYGVNSIDCSSSADILNHFSWMQVGDAYSVRFYYDIANTNGNKINNDYGEWQVTAKY